MRWGDDTEEAFPPRHPREPGGLRQDILDEIADHLACAVEREADRGGENDNEETVWGRVLERFGNPDAIARKLWWDEMRETVMREWIQTGVMVAVAVAVVVFMALVTRQMSTANQAVLEALKSNATAVNPLVTLKVKVTRGTEDGPPAEGVRVILNGAAFGGESAFVSRSADSTGNLQFGPMQPGQYRIYSFDPQSGLTSNHRTETLFAGETDEQIRLVAPDTELVPTNLAFDMPFKLSGNRALRLWIESTWGEGEATWNRRMEVLTDGTRWWTRYTDPSGDEQPVSLDDVDAQGVLSRASWKDVQVEGEALQMSGAIESVYVALLEEEVDKRVRRVLHEQLEESAFGPTADASSYRLTLPEAFRRYFFDLQAEEHATERGVELDAGLWRTLRDSYPELVVDGAVLVSGCRTGLSVAGTLVSRPLNQPDTSLAFVYNDTLEGYRTGSGQAFGETVATSVVVLKGPPEELISSAGGGRILLALNVEQLNAEEFNQELQVWPILSPVIDHSWMPYETMEASTLSSGLKLALGPNPLVSIPVPKLAKELDVEEQKSDWLLLDLSENLLAADVSLRGKEFVLRWARMELEYKSLISVISAEAREMKFEDRRPMWIVLKPMAAKEATAAQ